MDELKKIKNAILLFKEYIIPALHAVVPWKGLVMNANIKDKITELETKMQ